jgi:hypothetical protein
MDRNIIIAILATVSIVFIYLIVKTVYSVDKSNESFDAIKNVTFDDSWFANRQIANIPNGYPDLIMKYDMSKITDPFIEPTQRVPRQDIQPIILKQMIDIPTRGYPDSYSQLGILVRDDDCHKKECNTDNKILRLFGRQIYPGSYTYEYYTMANSGNDQIKIPIDTRRKQLYDDDKIRIEELNRCYRVRLYEFDAPRYYPDVI